MRKTLTAGLTLGALGLAALTGAASAQTLAPVVAGTAYSAYAVDDVARTGAITPRGDALGAAPFLVPDRASDLDGTLHLFGPRTDGRPY